MYPAITIAQADASGALASSIYDASSNISSLIWMFSLSLNQQLTQMSQCMIQFRPALEFISSHVT
jgi:hypothetical protein